MAKTTRKITIESFKNYDELGKKIVVITLWHGKKPIADIWCYDKPKEVRITKLSLYYLVGVSIGNNIVTFRAEVLEDLRSEI